MPTKNITA